VRLLAATCDVLAEAQGALLFAGDQSGGPTRQFRLLRRAERLDTELVSEGLEGVAAGLGTSKRSLLRAFGAIGYDAVKHLVLCRIERRPPRLDLEIYPYLPTLPAKGALTRVSYMEAHAPRRPDDRNRWTLFHRFTDPSCSGIDNLGNIG